MGVLVRTLAGVEQRADTVQPFAIKDWLGRIVGPGAPVTTSSAMRLTVVLTCIRIIAEGVSSMPLVTYRRVDGGGRVRDPDFHLSELLAYEPNPEMEAVTFIETLTAHVAGWGNGYAEVVRDDGNRPTALWPLRPDRMVVTREGGPIIYRYTRPDGRRVDMTADQVLHIRGLSFDGMVGYSVLANQQAIELAQAAQDYGTAFFRNGGRPGLVLSHPKTLTQAAIDRLAAQFEALKGPGNSGKTLVMEEGLSLNEVGIPPEQAQYLETRKFQRAEIIGLFRIPPHKAGDTDRSTSWGTGIESQNRQFIDEALASYLRRWEQAIRRTLIGKVWRGSHYAEFNRDVLLRADTLTRYQAHHYALMDGWKNSDEVREYENLDRIPNGDGEGYYKPLNMVPVGATSEAQDSAARTLADFASRELLPDPLADLAVLAATNGHAKENHDG